MKPRTPVSLYIIGTIGLTILAFEMFAQDTGYLSTAFFWALLIIEAILLLIVNAIGDLIETEKFKLLSEEEKTVFLQEKQTPYYIRLWNSAFKKQSQVEEKDMLIDHGFDGITELDNSLPKWWVGLFYFGVIFYVVYLKKFIYLNWKWLMLL